MKFKYYLAYKPYQVLCQFTSTDNKKTLKDCFPYLENDIYPIGRLDYDSEGLLILSNNPKLNNAVLNPKANISKIYWSQVEGIPDSEQIANLKAGVNIKVNNKNHLTSPANITLLEGVVKVGDRNPPIRFRKNIPTSWIQLIITEGKNRQVRKMTASVNLPTLRLIRVGIGKIKLDNLAAGEILSVEFSKLKQLLNLTINE